MTAFIAFVSVNASSCARTSVCVRARGRACVPTSVMECVHQTLSSHAFMALWALEETPHFPSQHFPTHTQFTCTLTRLLCFGFVSSTGGWQTFSLPHRVHRKDLALFFFSSFLTFSQTYWLLLSHVAMTMWHTARKCPRALVSRRAEMIWKRRVGLFQL